jgi:hypothetical protein
LHIAYAAILEEAICDGEWLLAYDSCFEHSAREQDIDFVDVRIDGHDALRWIIGLEEDDSNWNDEITGYPHLGHLMEIRAFMPSPAWRQPTEMNFFLIGYGK